MRIDATNLPGPSQLKTAERSETRAQMRAAEGAGSSDTASLSSGQHRVESLVATVVGQYPEVRQHKVAALAEKVRNGSYDASASRTAETLMAAMVIQPAA